MLEKKNAPVGTCNLLLVLGMLEDGERAGHEIITALERQCDRTFSGQEVKPVHEENERLAAFLDAVCEPLFWPPYRRRVRRELADHILSRAALLERSAGCSHAEAVGLAVLAMGEPHALGLRLRRSRFPLRGLLLTLLTCLVWTAIAACLLYLLCRV